MVPMMFNVVFPAFETSEGYEACTSIGIVDDLELEGDQQDFTIHIGTIDPPNVIAPQPYAIVRIQDNDEDGKNTATLCIFSSVTFNGYAYRDIRVIIIVESAL